MTGDGIHNARKKQWVIRKEKVLHGQGPFE